MRSFSFLSLRPLLWRCGLYVCQVNFNEEVWPMLRRCGLHLCFVCFSEGGVAFVKKVWPMCLLSVAVKEVWPLLRRCGLCKDVVESVCLLSILLEEVWPL